MNEKTCRILEFHKILEKLVSKTISQPGREMAAALKPSSDIDEIQRSQQETTEAAGFSVRRGPLPLGGMKDLRGSLQRASAGGVLNIEELLQVGDFCHVSGKVIRYSSEDRRSETWPMLDPLFDNIMPLQSLEKEISRCIRNAQEIADDASRKLSEIRRNMKVYNNRIKEQLNSMIHSQTYKNMIQDSVITIRNDRYCIPIKQEYRQTFQGMIHDQSATGATVFIEPMAVVQLNNKIKELKVEEKMEIERILQDLSIMTAEYAEQIQLNQQILTRLDFIFAKGELSLEMGASQPKMNEDGWIHIHKGRHPLLSQETVVPTDIYLGRDFHTLLITGPNTGGKTVALKTLGLFSLMGQAGLHIPAGEHSELAVFTEIFADIGDEQSIEQSLSTFSAHMRNIVEILKEAVQHPPGACLVLLDELGAGTDPTEGAALAVSILQYLHRFRICTAVTTHYSELKVYALSTEGVENASCEFDVETLRPTYRLLIGIPGKSNAFAISQKLGLPDAIIQEAKEFLSHEDQHFEDVITDLEISRKTVILEQERAESYRREAENFKNQMEKQKKKLEAQREKILLTAREEARQQLQAARDEADVLIREMRKQMRENASQKDMESSRQKISQKLSQVQDELSRTQKQEIKGRPADRNLKKGESVFVHSMNLRGTVLEPPDGDGRVLVQAGIMKIQVNLSDLSLGDENDKIKVNVQAWSAPAKAKKSRNISPEIDLRGCMVEEGLEKLDKYLDDAWLAGLKQVTVIHGKGTGALRNAVHQYLKSHHCTQSYRLGAFGEGDHGVTIVELS